MKEITEAIVREIDQNNTKGMELLRSIIRLQEEDDDSIALDVIAECALEYLAKNDKLLGGII